jgi:ketosteroid isomerase-like protein
MIGALVAKKALAGSYDALNRHDLPKFMSAWRDDGVFVYPGDVPESGTFQGKRAVEDWFRHFLEQFPGIKFDIQDICVRNIFDLVGTNAVAAHWKVELTNRDGHVGHNRGVTVVSLKGGKAVLVQDYLFDLGDNFRRYWSRIR